MTFVYRFTWWICRILFGTYFRWRVHNPENVPIEGPVILASNHASFLDPPLIGSAIPRPINYLARESLFRAPLVGTYFRALNSVPVDRDGAGAKGLKMILNRLLGGGGIILFPEGTRTSDDKLQPARSGVGLTVIKSTAPVVPVRVFGTFQAWNRKMIIPRPRRVQVRYGEVMEFKELREEAKTCDKKRLKIIYQEVADQIMAEIGKLSVG
ncbi:MAG: lysophospholipid acyltransferase family protein [Verrucomicrobiia bacterium]|jgi:1-acyl-sn-glycerol-3-phosphate acyltransferase